MSSWNQEAYEEISIAQFVKEINSGKGILIAIGLGQDIAVNYYAKYAYYNDGQKLHYGYKADVPALYFTAKKGKVSITSDTFSEMAKVSVATRDLHIFKGDREWYKLTTESGEQLKTIYVRLKKQTSIDGKYR